MILARYAEYSGDSILTLVGGDIDKLVAEEYPFVLPVLTAAIRLELNRHEVQASHRLNCRVLREETNEVLTESSVVEIPRFSLAGEPDEDAKLSIGMVANVPNVVIPAAGKFDLQVIVDEKVVGKVRFRAAPLAFYKARGMPAVIQAEVESDDAGAVDDQQGN